MAEKTFEWPEGVPENYDELARDWGPFVLSKIQHYNKVSRNLEDLFQDIWVRLMTSRVIEKYVAKAGKTPPPTFLAWEACAYLGVTFEAFLDAQERYRATEAEVRPVWMPEPMKGSYSSRGAVYSRVDIVDLDNLLGQEGNNIAERTEEQVMPFVGAQGFKRYLGQALHNHFANWCRDRSRHYKESLLAPTAILAPMEDGTAAHVGYSEEGSAWEQALVSASMSAEDVAQCSRYVDDEIQPIASVAQIDMHKIHDFEVYVDEDGIERRRATKDAQRGLGVLDFLAKGCTVREAVKAQIKEEVREADVERATARLTAMMA